MNLTRLAAALAVATAAFGAQAATFDFGPHDLLEASFALPNTPGFVGAGAFADLYTFTLASAEVLTSTVVTNNLGTLFSITGGQYTIIDTVTLAPVSASFAFSGTTGSTSHSVALAAGSYAYSLTGTVDGVVGYYSLTSTTVPVVPEPTSLAMLLAGLGVVGFLMKRRQG